MRNQEMRSMIKKAGLKIHHIAEVMKVHENTVFRLLRFTMSEKKKTELLAIINELKDRKGSVEQRIDEMLAKRDQASRQ